MESIVAQPDDLRRIFQDAVSANLAKHIISRPDPGIVNYLSDLMLGFIHTDRIFAIRDRFGNRVISVADMVAEGDIRLNADSFERERQVHKHIGDFLLFWSGVYPEFLRQLKLAIGHDVICDYRKQGRESYFLVSTFTKADDPTDPDTYRTLSEGFDDLAFCLRTVRDDLNLVPWNPPGRA